MSPAHVFVLQHGGGQAPANPEAVWPFRWEIVRWLKCNKEFLHKKVNHRSSTPMDQAAIVLV
eukprot:COSAG04_NODE_16352_length_502_cov_0.709677_1_plen_61_part_10